MTLTKKSRSRRWIYALGATIVIAIVVYGVRYFDDGSAQTAARSAENTALVPVTAALAKREDVPAIVNAVGTVQSIDSVSVQPRVTGAIMKIEFVPGQDVKQGQELFLIDPRPYQAALNQTQAQLAHDRAVLAEAQIDLTRYQTLAKQNSIAKQQAEDQVYVVEQDKGTVQLDQANVDTAQLNVDFCHVEAPISGRAGALMVDLGNLVGPQASSQTTSGTATTSASTTGGQAAASNSLVSIAQLAPIYVSFNVPQNDLDEILHNQAAAPLDINAYAQTGKLLGNGKLTLINNQVNTASGTVMLQATFANTNEALWPGQYVSATLIVATRHNVVTLPAPAVMVGPNGDYVYVIGADDKVNRVDVQVTSRQGGISVIEKGISAGQKVVTAGQDRLDNGTKVAVQQTTEPQPPAPAAIN